MQQLKGKLAILSFVDEEDNVEKHIIIRISEGEPLIKEAKINGAIVARANKFIEAKQIIYNINDLR